ncbi:helix-turn-helix domain-containing protein [Actinomadura opuntiae]|uniref:helix-turn-helix domain-containing protein n=1 Tax=Actinomadura sp. OS1-43 TaxID=604315 RepID=UPI00255B0752|nr:helix-turn-helix domain-containing protein [Actinomadura sp. OS1-43]MDL4817354.1 helix-turn-helix domain-containing protein [Actinomadura sp. OS1-43]
MKGLTAAEIRSLPATIDLVTAGRIVGVGRTKAYQLARSGRFPCRVLRIGRNYRVCAADLIAVLGLACDNSDDQHSCGQQAPREEAE